MSYRFSGNQQNYNALDFTELKNDLELAEIESMDDRTYAIAKYKATGERPVKVAKSDAESFGLRRAFWDIYSPVEGVAAGQWKIEKDATTGEEFIIRKESNIQGDTK
jgi:hypothetical protein